MTTELVGNAAETRSDSTLEAVILRGSHCPACGFGTQNPEDPGLCRDCGGPIVTLGEPVPEDLGVVSGPCRPCPACGYTNDWRRDACKRCAESVADVQPTENPDRSFLKTLAQAWRDGWHEGRT